MTQSSNTLKTSLIYRYMKTPIHSVVAIALLFVLFPILQVYITRSAPYFLVAAGFITLIPELIIWKKTNEADWQTAIKCSPVLCSFWLFWTWMVISITWSALPEKAAFSSLTIAGFALCVWLLSRAIARVDRSLLFWIVTITVIMTSLFLISEITHTTLQHWEKGSQTTPDLNRNVLFLIGLVWPLVLLAKRQKKQTVAILIVFTTVSVAVYLSHSSSARLALFLSITLFIILNQFSKVGSYVFVLMAASLLFTPIAVKVMSPFIPSIQKANAWTAASRVHIWNGHMDLLKNKPILGYGAFGDRHAGMENKIPYTGITKGLIPVTKHTTHAHSATVQIWFNFGLVGALLGTLFLSLAGWRANAFGKQQTQAVVLTTTVLFLSTVAGASLFQGWMLASIAIIVSFLLASLELTTQPA